jgi:hypothetical protein
MLKGFKDSKILIFEVSRILGFKVSMFRVLKFKGLEISHTRKKSGIPPVDVDFGK